MNKRAVGLIVLSKEGDRVAIVRKTHKATGPLAGRWHFPSETIEQSELPQKAAERGVIEELGLLADGFIEICNTINNYGGKEIEIRWFECEAQVGELRPGDDAVEAVWIERSSSLERIDPIALNLLPKEVKLRLKRPI